MKIDQLKGGAALSYVNILLTNIIGLLITPFIIRSLGSAEYGLYTMIGALVGYMSVLDFGLNNTVIRYVAKYRANNDKRGEENFLAHSLIMYACISALIITLGLIIHSQLGSWYEDTLTADQLGKARTMMLILIFNLAVSLPGGTFGAICSGYEEFVLPKIVNIIRYLLRSLLVVGLLFAGGDSVGLVILDTCMHIVIIIANAIIVFRKLKVNITLHLFDIGLFKSILAFSLWIFVFAIVHQLRWQFGQLVLGLYFSTTVVAIYAVGITLGNYLGAFSSAISSVFLPRAIQMTVQKTATKELTNTFIKISRVIILILLFVLGGFIVVGKDFVFFWVGDEYMLAYYYTIIIMLGLTPILCQSFASNILDAKNIFKYRGSLLLITTVLGTITGVYMIKWYGPISFVVSTVLFMFIERLFMIPHFAKKANLQMSRYYREIAPLFLMTMIIVSIFSLYNYFSPYGEFIPFLIKGVLYSLFYFVSMYLIMTEFEKSLINSLLSKILKIKYKDRPKN